MSAKSINTQNRAAVPLRVWPGVAAAIVLVLIRYAVPLVLPDAGGTAILGGMVTALVIVLWWVLFSRAPWLDRIGAIVVIAAAIWATSFLVHPSVSNGFMGLMLPIFAIPLATVGLVAGATAARHLPDGRRRAVMSATILLACAGMTVVRTGGVTGDASSDIRWRWSPTPEERLLAERQDEPVRRAAVADAEVETPAPPAAAASGPAPDEATGAGGAPLPPEVTSARPPVTSGPADAATSDVPAGWPGFRGAARDGVVPGIRIATDWSQQPPVELWRRPIGPGWSSFAVSDQLLFTQEQRGEEEIVSAYRLATGEPVWSHRDRVRFWESNGGPGPRATPAVQDQRVYSLGATGILNALDARTGAPIWSRDAARDAEREVPDWGFAGSPLVIGDRVVVALAGRLVAYDAHTGAMRWVGPPEGGGYSSPHLATLDGVPQVLLLRGRRTTSVAPSDGTVLWEDSWQPATSIVQPALTADGDILIAAAEGMGGTGIRRIAVAHGPSGWMVEERWISRGLKPYFNDFVVHRGHAYGFDASILACIDLADGMRKWKGGRFGHGQLLLLMDQDLLLVLSEDGELALASATPDAFRELARTRVLEGKTWNHPALVGDVLLVRNGEEMAAFRMRREP